MNHTKSFYLIALLLIASTLACGISGIGKQASSVQETAQAIKTDVGGIVTAGGALLNTAQAIYTQHPGVLETVQSLTTQGAPLLSTIQAVATDNPGLPQTAQAFIQQELPTGEAPTDIPILNPDQVENYFGSSQYIFYTTPMGYSQLLEFYKTEMPSNGWQYLESTSNEYANAAQLNYYKDNRIATINLSINPFNNTSVVVISIGS
jgi:hypothetical protein